MYVSCTRLLQINVIQGVPKIDYAQLFLLKMKSLIHNHRSKHLNRILIRINLLFVEST